MSRRRCLVPLLVLMCAACERGIVVDDGDDPTPPVKSFAIADPRDGVHLELSWENPTLATFRGVRVLRRAGEEPLSSTDAFAQVAYEGKAEAWVDEGFDGAAEKKPLVVGTTYHYAAYAMYGESAYASPARAFEEHSAFGPARTFIVAVTPTGPLALAWTLPDPIGDAVEVKIRRARVAAPGQPGALDAKVVYQGTHEAWSDAGVVSGTRYFYSTTRMKAQTS